MSITAEHLNLSNAGRGAGPADAKPLDAATDCPCEPDVEHRVIEFFSGVGGLHYALKLANISHRVVHAFDMDEMALKTYQLNHAGTSICGSDLRRLSKRC